MTVGHYIGAEVPVGDANVGIGPIITSVPTPSAYKAALRTYDKNLPYAWVQNEGNKLATEFCTHVYQGEGSTHFMTSYLPMPNGPAVYFRSRLLPQTRDLTAQLIQ